MRGIGALFVFLCLAVSPLHASCGSTSCPIDLHSLQANDTRGFSLDLSFQYIDQNQPRIGTHRATIGAIPSDHDEVRTLNRLAALQLGYGVSDSLQLMVIAPYVSRMHEHIDGATHSLDQWRFGAVGDVVVQGRYRLFDSASPPHPSLWLSTAVKLPTGKRDEISSTGEAGEVTITPGTGSTDVIVGLTYQSGFLRETKLIGPLGRTTLIPYFIGMTLRENGRGTHHYRRGRELQLNAGTEYPSRANLHLLGQINARSSAKDNVGTTGENRELTGGQYVFASPGLRFILGRGTSLYGVVQVPVYQHVNGIQLTARANYLIGVHRSF